MTARLAFFIYSIYKMMETKDTFVNIYWNWQVYS